MIKNQTKILVFTTYTTIKKIDDVNKYLIFDSTDEIKELLKKHNHAWKIIKDKIKEISSGERDYEKEYMKT